MHIDIADQRKGSHPTLIEIDGDLVEAYCGMAGVDMAEDGVLKIRIRNGSGPYGFTQRVKGGYRVVLNVRYSKTHLSEKARYVVSNTLLHEIGHVAQMQGSMPLDPDYHGWSETEARAIGRLIKGKDELLAVR